jgi:hypothetical protein
MEREHEVLCLAARTALDADARARLARLTGGPLDWERLWEQGHLHEVLPLVTRSLRELGAAGQVPAAWLSRGERRRCATLLRTTMLAEELVSVASALREAGVEAMPVKGVVLGELVYGDLSLRTAVDLDVLVRPEDLLAARASLAALGFRQRAEHSFKALHHGFHDPAHFRPVGGETVRLELHRGLWAPQQFQPYGELWSRSAGAELRGTPVRILSPEDMLLHQAIHRTRSPLRLRFLCDVAEVLRRYEAELDWGLALRLAGTAGARTALFVALSLSRELLGAPAPVEVEEELRPGRAKRRLLDRTCGATAMFRPVPPGEVDQQPHLILRILEQDGASHIATGFARAFVRKGRERLFERRRRVAVAVRW